MQAERQRSSDSSDTAANAGGGSRGRGRGTASPPAPSKSVPAVKRAAAILSYLAGQSRPMNLSHIAQAIDVFPGTCLQILRELTQARLVTFDARYKTYRLGQGLVDLAKAVMRQDPFAEAATPRLREIAELYGVTSTATARCDDEHVACVALAQPPTAMALHVTLGGRVPLFSGAAGRCFAAFGDEAAATMRRKFKKVRWQVPLSYEQWLREVENVPRAGFAEDHGMFTRGVTTLALPVFARDASLQGVIGIGAISAQLEDRLKQKMIRSLKRVASEIGSGL